MNTFMSGGIGGYEGWEGDWEDGSNETSTGFEPYADLTGLSGVSLYRLQPEQGSMDIMFKSGSNIYTYPFNEKLAQLAEQGWGLNRTLNAMRGH